MLKDRVKIEIFETGIVLTIKEKNVTIIKEYATPCFIAWGKNNILIELHKNYFINHSTINHELYEGERFKRLLPQVLEHGDLLPRDTEDNPIFDLTVN